MQPLTALTWSRTNSSSERKYPCWHDWTDARISNKQLAELVGIAPSTALMRTRALSERGIVQGYEAKLNLSAIALSILISSSLKTGIAYLSGVGRSFVNASAVSCMSAVKACSGATIQLALIACCATE